MKSHDLWLAWSFEPGIAVPLLVAALLYLIGAREKRGVTLRQRCCFWTGWLLAALSLLSPLHVMGESLFSAHMLQHELLMLAAAPLLVLSRPLVPFLWALPYDSRRALGQFSKTPLIQRFWRHVTDPLTAWLLHAAVLWIWHAPALFQATLTNEAVHAAQHASFFGSALLFWWSLFYARGRRSYGWSVLYVFSTGVHTSILGALLTFSSVIWYPAYRLSSAAWGVNPLEDQQVGGLIMWVPGGLVYLAAGLVLLALWLRESDALLKRGSYALGTLVIPLLLLTGCHAGRSDTAAANLTGGDAERGSAAIYRYGCGSCHTIEGIANARGLVGPPLTGLRNRVYVAGMLVNTPANLTHWIREPQSVNPKTVMPNLGVTSRDANDIATYLYSIQ